MIDYISYPILILLDILNVFWVCMIILSIMFSVYALFWIWYIQPGISQKSINCPVCNRKIKVNKNKKVKSK